MSALSRRLRRRNRGWPNFKDCGDEADYAMWRMDHAAVLRVGRRRADTGPAPSTICGTCGHVMFGPANRKMAKAHRALHSRASRARQHAYRQRRRGRW